MNTIGVKVVIDTNVFITILGRQSPKRWIFDKICKGEFLLCVSQEILLEYEEILSQKMNENIARNVINFLLTSPQVQLINVFYHWQIISEDPDDNKFIDCSVSSNAYCLVSNDKHFNIARNIDFPKILILNLEEFEKEFNR